jgi:hypothetical protein
MNFGAVAVPDPDVDALVNANWDSAEDVTGMEVRVTELSTAQSVVSGSGKSSCAIETDMQSRLTLRSIGTKAAPRWLCNTVECYRQAATLC